MIHITPSISDRTEEEISIPGPSLAPAFVGMSKACMRRAGFSHGLCDETRTRLLCLSIDAYEGEPSHWGRKLLIGAGISALPIAAFVLGMKVMGL